MVCELQRALCVDGDHETLFHWACLESNIIAVKLLINYSIEMNIDLNAKNFDGCTGFPLACEIANTQISMTTLMELSLGQFTTL